ncbi:MAG: response regulator [Proteobacteria bacterium]|nr:response regulator [Pseudomonadota bacterium]
MQIKHRILVVDDDPMILKFLTEILERDYQLVTVASGEEALMVMNRFKPDIILLDIMMPGLDGYEVCRKTRTNKDLANVKVLFLSAKVTLKEKLKGYKVGGDDYITKPFEMEELLAKIKVFSRLKHEEDENVALEREFSEKQLEIFYKIQRKLNDIVYIKSDSPYCNVVSAPGKGKGERIRITIQALDDIFKGKNLIRVHRSFLVNPKKILSVNRKKNNEYKILLKSHNEKLVPIPVGRSYHEKLKNLIPSLFDN